MTTLNYNHLAAEEELNELISDEFVKGATDISDHMRHLFEGELEHKMTISLFWKKMQFSLVKTARRSIPMFADHEAENDAVNSTHELERRHTRQ